MDLAQQLKVSEVQISLLTEENERLKQEVLILKDILQIKERFISTLHKAVTT